MSGEAMDILREHQLLTSRSGRAICSEHGCEWLLDFPAIEYDAMIREGVPVWVEESYAAHVLELLRGVGFVQEGRGKADIALRRIASEVQLMEWGGVITGECGPLWVEPARPFPRGGRMIKEILVEGGWK